MNNQNALHTLLDDLLHDEQLESFKADLHATCKEELARKRRTWIGWWPLATAAAILVVFFRLFMLTGIDDVVAPAQAKYPAYYASTVPLTQDQIVTTPGHLQDRIVTTPDTVENRYLVRTHVSVERVHTEKPAPFLMLNDQEMLALFVDVPCGLVEEDENRKSLFFLNPEDENKFVAKLGG